MVVVVGMAVLGGWCIPLPEKRGKVVAYSIAYVRLFNSGKQACLINRTRSEQPSCVRAGAPTKLTIYFPVLSCYGRGWSEQTVTSVDTIAIGRSAFPP